MMLFLVLFQKQTPYTCGKSMYFRFLSLSDFSSELLRPSRNCPYGILTK